MARGDGPADGELWAAWKKYLADLEAAGEAVFGEGMPTSPEERSEGLRYLLQGTSIGVELFMENADTQFPYLTKYFTPSRKQAGDNADAEIIGAWIDGRETYRVVGNRGTARWVVFSTLREPGDDDESFGMEDMGLPYTLVRDAEPLLSPELETEWDGSFVVWLSPDEHPGNWIRTTPRTCHLRIRVFHGDWVSESPMTARIERVGSTGAPPLLDPATFAARLARTGDFARTTTEYWGQRTVTRPGPINVMIARPPEDSPGYVPPGGSLIGKLDANPGGVNGSCHWRLGPDDALVVEFQPVPAYFWAIELDNVWVATVDYRWRLSNLNSTSAVREDDGSVRFVLSARDPGVPNWLDTSGWTEGSLNYRGLISTVAPAFTSEVVDVATLPASLPGNARRTTPEERAAQLRQQGAGVTRRFPA